MTDFIDFNNDIIPVVVTSNLVGGDVASALAAAASASDAAAAEAVAAAAAAAVSAASGGSFALGYDDADTRTGLARFNEMPVSVGEFAGLVVAGVGGLPDDWTAAIQAALDADRNVYLPGRTGGYYIKDELVFRSGGNMLVGDGVAESYLVIDRDFDLASLGIIRIPNGADESQAGFHDIGFEFKQPGDNYISAIAVSTGGSGYASVPTVTISGGGGSGALARAVLTAGAVSSIVITRNGTGYTSAPTVTITGGGGTGATAGAVTRVASVVRANVVQYPYALSARDVSRLMLGNLRITGGYNGLDLRDNTGGLMGGRWEIGCINEGLTGGDAAGGTAALDFWHIDTLHFWPFGWQSGTNYTTYRDGSTVAARLGRIDGIQVKDFSTFTGRVITEAAAGEGPFGTIGGLQLDGRYARLEFTAGRMAIGAFYGTTDLAGDYKIRVAGGHVNVASAWSATSATTGTTPLFSAAGGYLSVANMTVANCNPGAAVCQSETNGEMQVHGCTFLGIFGTTRTLAVVRQVGTGVMHCTDNIFQIPGSGTGSAISVETDSASITIKDNIYNGWGVTLPPEPVSGYLGDYGQSYGTIRTIAAADPLPLLPSDQFVTVTGNTTIGTWQTTRVGHRLRVRFTGTPTLNNNPGNVTYSGSQSFAAQAGLMLDMVMTVDGWMEASPRCLPTTAGGWLTSTPAVTGTSGDPTATANLRYRRDVAGDIDFQLEIACSNIAASTAGWQVTMPFGAEYISVFAGSNISTGNGCQGRMAAGSAILQVFKYDNAAPGTTGESVVVSGRYRGDL